MSLKTQIGGKYSAANTGLFELKAMLTEKGFEVRHPIADKIFVEKAGLGLAFEESDDWPTFELVERNYYNCLKNADFHIVQNDFTYHGLAGYVGSSTAVEVAFCTVVGTPVVFCKPPVLAHSVPPEVEKIINENITRYSVFKATHLASKIHRLHELASLRPRYLVEIADFFAVAGQVAKILNHARSV